MGEVTSSYPEQIYIDTGAPVSPIHNTLVGSGTLGGSIKGQTVHGTFRMTDEGDLRPVAPAAGT